MAFRFTPPCCCGDSDCMTICLPQCREIYRGIPCEIFHPRDTIDTSQIPLDEGVLCQINLTASYDPARLDCAYFEVYEGIDENTGKYFARQTRIRSYGTHRIGRVSYNMTFPPGYGEDRSSSVFGSIFGSPSVDYRYTSWVSVYNSPGPELPMLAEHLVFLASYDNIYHSVSLGLNCRRVFCLPFNEPLCLHENDYETAVELSSDSIEGCYVSIRGNGTEGCSFSWSTSCSIVTDANYNKVFGSDLLSGKISSSVNSKTESLDFYVIRLFGFDNTDGVAIETGLTYGKTSSNQMVAILVHNVATTNFAITAANYDPDYSKTGHQDYPLELLEYAECKPSLDNIAPATAVDARIIFGSSDTQTFGAVNSVGAPNAMPNNWNNPTLSRAATTNGERFNGIFWVFAAWSKCGDTFPQGGTFPQTVTGGSLSNVPVAKIKIDNSSSAWRRSAYNESTLPFSATSIVEVKSSYNNSSFFESPSFTDTLTSPNLPHPNDPPGPSNPWQQKTLADNNSYFIPKLSGKSIVRLIWRAWMKDAFFISSQSGSSFDTMCSLCNCITAGQYIKNPPNDRYRDQYPGGWGLGYNGTCEFTPYNVTGVPLSYNHDQLDVQYDLNKYNKSVNGDHFTDVTQYAGFSGYMPTVDDTQLQHLFGVSSLSSCKFIVVGPVVEQYIQKDSYSLQTANWSFGQDVYVYPLFDFDYIAVWEDD